MAEVFRVAIMLAIGALGNVSFVIGGLKFDLTRNMHPHCSVSM
jgi:hypothetical protein